MSISRMHKLQKQVLAVLQNLKEGLWKYPSPLGQELLPATPSQGTATEASVGNANAETTKGDSEMKDESPPQEGDATSANQDVPHVASSSCNKDEGISRGGASAPSVSENTGDASEPSQASADNPAASPPTQSTDVHL